MYVLYIYIHRCWLSLDSMVLFFGRIQRWSWEVSCQSTPLARSALAAEGRHFGMRSPIRPVTLGTEWMGWGWAGDHRYIPDIPNFVLFLNKKWLPGLEYISMWDLLKLGHCRQFSRGLFEARSGDMSPSFEEDKLTLNIEHYLQCCRFASFKWFESGACLLNKFLYFSIHMFIILHRIYEYA